MVNVGGVVVRCVSRGLALVFVLLVAGHWRAGAASPTPDALPNDRTGEVTSARHQLMFWRHEFSALLHEFQTVPPDGAEERRLYVETLYDAGYAGVAARVGFPDDAFADARLRGLLAFRGDLGFGVPGRIRAASTLGAFRPTTNGSTDPSTRYLVARLLTVGADGILGHGDLRAAAAEMLLARGPFGGDQLRLLLIGGAGKDLPRFIPQEGGRVWSLVSAEVNAPETTMSLLASMKLTPEDEVKVLDRVAIVLHDNRLEDAARAFLARFPKATPRPEWEFDHHYEADDYSSGTPEATVRRYLRAQTQPGSEAEFAQLSAKNADNLNFANFGPHAQDDYSDLYTDRQVAARSVTVDGDPATGWHVRWERAIGDAWNFFLVDEGGPRLLSDGRDRSALALEAGRRLDAGDVVGGLRWLDWAYEGTEDPARSLWPRGGDRSASAARLAVSVFATSDSRGGRWLPVLKAAWAASHDPFLSRRLASAETEAKDWRAVLALSEVASPLDPSKGAWWRRTRVRALAGLGRFSDAEREAAADLARGLSGDELRLLAEALADGNDLIGASEFATLAQAANPGDLGLANDALWFTLFQPGRSPPTDLIRILGVQPWDSTYAHTLACALALRGEPDAARELVRDHVQRHLGRMEGPWMLAWGLIADADGLGDQAIAAYREVPASDEPDSSYALATRRLKEHGALR